MKISRLCAYAAAGIIVGLITENTAMRIKNRAESKAGDIKKKMGKKLDKIRA